MFILNENFEVDQKILRCDYNTYSPFEIITINTANSQINNNIPREDSVISLLNSYLYLNFDVVHAATNKRYAVGNDMSLVNLGTNAFLVIII